MNFQEQRDENVKVTREIERAKEQRGTNDRAQQEENKPDTHEIEKGKREGGAL